MINPIALAIPFFLVLIAMEALYGWWSGRALYRPNDATSDLMCGVSSQLTGLLTKFVSAGAYIVTYDQLRLFQLEPSVATWIGTFLVVDLAYYAWHRWTHSMNLGWASHVVHHQSEDYNLAVALRQSMTSTLTSWPFYLPLALLGVPPLVALTCMALNTLYQFWIHTEAIGTLGPVEWVMNTPSHHRVHHGINEAYLDKNHAGVFIVWDRLFGTFEPEVEPPVYGTVTKLESLDPLWANFWWMDRMARTAIATPRWQDKLGVLFRGPAFSPPGTPAKAPRASAKYDPQGPSGAAVYVLLHFVPIAALTTWILWRDRTLLEIVAPAMLVFVGTVTLPALFEGRRWFLPAEMVRLAGLAVFAFTLTPALGLGATAGGLVSVGWLLTRRSS